ncbi:MAG: helix-turn-helix transcriptional regulator [Clostridia bacterium]|nr:helix-turn-helix transcriptional regulator [Clostridia bacterium]
MKKVFSLAKRHKISESNINYYANPFVHPKRKMACHDFIYLLDGKWKIGQNGVSYQLEKDTVLILTANDLHYGVSPCEKNTKTMYFHVSKEKGDKDYQAGEVLTDEQVVLEPFIDVSQNPNVKKYFLEIVNNKLSNEHKKADIYFDLLLTELAENHRKNQDSECVEIIKNAVHNNPERFFTNRQLAKMANVSLKTAENKFKATFNKTIHRYILDFKIEMAQSYFKTYPNISVKEVAFNLGFYDEYHFSKQFTRLVKIPPSKYKKSLQTEKNPNS